MQIHFDDAPKPILSPICIFVTSLQPEDYREVALLASGTDWHPHVWPNPLEINAHGRLAPSVKGYERSSDCFRLERLPGGICTHWKAPPLHGAHPQRTSFTWAEQDKY
jgi:hypothetical protein